MVKFLRDLGRLTIIYTKENNHMMGFLLKTIVYLHKTILRER